jgi:hypothetical protein
MTNVWAWWEDALTGRIGNITTTPEWGYYKTKTKAGPWEPVAIWQDEQGNWYARRNNRPVEADEVWTWCCRHPITHDAYEQAVESGKWADDDPTVVSMIGHNVGDDLEALRDQIENAAVGAEAYLTITTDDQAGKAQSLRARMNELAGTADKAREKLKRPHLEAGKAVDAEWMPLVRDAKAIADLLRKGIEAYQTVKLQEQRRLEAERRREEEAARRAGEEVVAPPPPPPIEDKVKGTYGRAATVGVETVVAEVTDQDALYKYMRDRSEVLACLTELARRAVKAGRTDIPGIKLEERAKIS